MTRIHFAVILLLATAPVTSPAREPRIADVRVGQHGDYDRIVVQFDAPTEVRWLDDAGADVFEIGARPRHAQQQLSAGRPHLGELTLRAADAGARLALEPRERRTRAFLLSNPARLVIDVTGPGAAAFEPPASVRALRREVIEAAAPESAPAPEAAADEPAAAEVAPLVGESESAASEELLANEDVAAAEPIGIGTSEATSWLGSRALLVPLLAGLGLLLLAGGGLALAGAQRSRPKRRMALAGAGSGEIALEASDALLSADRIDLVEKRLDEEVRARLQLEEQLTQAREELGGLRDLLARLRRDG